MSEGIFRKELTEADYKKYAEEDQDQWVTYGPRGLVDEAKGLASASGIDLSVAMTACVESKRNYELQMIRKKLTQIEEYVEDQHHSLRWLEGISNILSRIEKKT